MGQGLSAPQSAAPVGRCFSPALLSTASYAKGAFAEWLKGKSLRKFYEPAGGESQSRTIRRTSSSQL